MPIARPARKSALLHMAGSDPADSGWTVPTGDYTVRLYDANGNELSGGGYSAGTIAVTGCFALYGSGASWSVRNAATIRIPNSGEASAEWAPIRFVKLYANARPDPDLEFELDADVAVTTGLHYEISPGELILDDGSE